MTIFIPERKKNLAKFPDEHVEEYIRDGKIIPDLIVPMSEHRTFKYFKEETITLFSVSYGPQTGSE